MGLKPPLMTGEQFRRVFEPNPDMIAEFGAFGVTNHVYLHWHDNTSTELTYEQCEEIATHALVVVGAGVDNQWDIWGIQWPREYKPTIKHV